MNSQKQSRIYTMKYAAIQGAYWSVYCASYSFLSVFLLSKDFSNSQIGLLLAIANIIAVFLQPAVASFADTTRRISLKNLSALMAGIAAIFAALIIFIPGAHMKLLLSVILILELTILFSLQPMANSLGMQMINRGIALNFGLARGLGSISFAALSSLIGVLIAHFGPDAAPVVSFLMLLCFMAAAVSFRAPAQETISSPLVASSSSSDAPSSSGSDASSSSGTDTAVPTSGTDNMEETQQESLGILAFAKRYKRFMVLLLATAITFCAHTLINNYFIQITEAVGGNTQNMGTAIAVAAVVELPAMALFLPLTKRIKCSTILKLSFVFFLIKSILTFVAGSVWMLYVAQTFQFFSYALFIPASIYYVNLVINKHDLVKGQAFITCSITLSGVIASLLGGILLDGPGVKIMLFIGVIFSIVGLVLCIPSTESV